MSGRKSLTHGRGVSTTHVPGNSGTTASLIEDTTQNRIATKLSDSFFHEFRFQPAPSEVNSWRNSLRAVSPSAEDSNTKPARREKRCSPDEDGNERSPLSHVGDLQSSQLAPGPGNVCRPHALFLSISCTRRHLLMNLRS